MEVDDSPFLSGCFEVETRNKKQKFVFNLLILRTRFPLLLSGQFSITLAPNRPRFLSSVEKKKTLQSHLFLSQFSL